MLRLNVKLSEVQLLRLRATFHALRLFFCERKFYARTHVKITRHWKSMLMPSPVRMRKVNATGNQRKNATRPLTHIFDETDRGVKR